MQSIFDQNNSMLGGYANGMDYTNYQPKELNWTNPLTTGEAKELHRENSALTLDIPKEEMMRAKCTHRDPNTHNFTLFHNTDGSWTCTRCGAQFNLVDNVDMEHVQKVIGGAYDILQTAKLAYIDMPDKAIETYFVILPFLQIAPSIYEMAMHTFKRLNFKPGISENGVSGSDMFSNLYSVTGNPNMMNPQMFQQQMAQMQQQMAQMAQMTQMQQQMMNNMNTAATNNPMQSKGPESEVKVTTAQFGLN